MVRFHTSLILLTEFELDPGLVGDGLPDGLVVDWLIFSYFAGAFNVILPTVVLSNSYLRAKSLEESDPALAAS
jgi:hypothetical protein